MNTEQSKGHVRFIGSGEHEFVIEGVKNGETETLVISANSKGQALRMAVQAGLDIEWLTVAQVPA